MMSEETVVENTETVDTDTGTPADTENTEATTEAPVDATLGADTAAEDVAQEVPADWPADWRQKMAGGDEEALKYLNRYKSPDNVYKALKSMRAKMDAGELRNAMPDLQNEEAMKAWRAENGIPETPEGYKEGLNLEGVDDEDMALIDKYMADMHAHGATPEQARAGLDSYYQMRDQLLEQQAETDKAFRRDAEDTLRAEWGPEFRANLNSMRNMLDMHGEEMRQVLFTARAADGTLLGDNPEVLKFLVSMSKELNPYGTVTPNAGETPVQTIDKEIAAIEERMKDAQGTGYWKDEAAQARYRELIDMKSRYAA